MARTNTNWKTVYLFKERADKIDCKKHFNPKEFDLTITKIQKIRKTRNCKYNLNYHFTFIPKTRMKVMINPFDKEIKQFLLEKCEEKQWDPLALQVMADHIHFFLSAPPKWSPSKIIQELKTYSSRKLRKKYAIIRDMRYTPDFWASGYYVGSAGHVTAHSVARYITEQNKKLEGKWHLFDLEPFEYDVLDGTMRLAKGQRKLNAYA